MEIHYKYELYQLIYIQLETFLAFNNEKQKLQAQS